MSFAGLNRADRAKLESEVVSNDARLRLTRIIRNRCASKDSAVDLINRNSYINVANAVLALPVYRLESDDSGQYENAEYAWHYGETELIMRRPNTQQLVEILGDMLQQHMLDVDAVNEILTDDNVSVRFEAHGFDEDISVRILTDEEIEEDAVEGEHPNIRLLAIRMDRAFDDKDYPGVLHASASIFETLAKIVFANPNVENEPLGAFFNGYRNRSALPAPLLDYILEIYKRRNTEPLAGHGSTTPPTVSAKEATTLIEMTKMCVRLERRLGVQEVEAAGVTGTAAQAPPAPATPAKTSSRAVPKPKKPAGRGRSASKSPRK